MASTIQLYGLFPIVSTMALCLFDGGYSEGTIRITGTITNCFNRPVADATVTLTQKGLHSQTNQDGRFTITSENTAQKRHPHATTTPYSTVLITLTDGRLLIRNGTDYDAAIQLHNLLGKKLLHANAAKNSAWSGKAPALGNVWVVMIETMSGIIENRILHLPGTNTFHVNGPQNAQPTHLARASLHNTAEDDILDTLLVTHPDYPDHRHVINDLDDSVAIRLGTTAHHNTGLHVYCDDTITTCGLDCHTLFYSISALQGNASPQQTCGISPDTAWLAMKYGTEYETVIDVFCPENSESTRTIRRILERSYDSVQVFDITFGPVCDELQLLYPNGGEHFFVGDTVKITWCCPDDWPHDQVKLILFHKSGKVKVRWLSANAGIRAQQHSFLWHVKESDIDDSCVIEISEYEDHEVDYVDSVFRVTMGSE